MSRSKPAYIGIAIARAIVAGDVDNARRLYSDASRNSWRVCEARAIIGACRYARSAYTGCDVSFDQFLGSTARTVRYELQSYQNSLAMFESL